MPRYRCRWLIAGAALSALMITASACAGDGEKESDEGQSVEDQTEVLIPRSALEALDEYAFTSDIQISSVEGQLDATFDASFQAPDRFQGALSATGEQYENLIYDLSPLELPLDAEVIAIGGQIWVREAGGNWRHGFGALGLLIFAGTPPLYLGGLFTFDSLRLPAAGPAETVNGVRARPVRLDKAGLIELLSQGTVCTEDPPCTAPWQDTQQAQEELPNDFVVETWIAEEGNYPTRIVITFSLDEDDGGFFLFTGPQSVRLQMDITDTDIDVEIEPPVTSVD